MLGLLHLGSLGICSVNIFKALLLPTLIDTARQWPAKKQIDWGTWVAPPTNKFTQPQTQQHQRLLQYWSIFCPSNTAKYNTMTKGGLSFDLQENHASSG